MRNLKNTFILLFSLSIFFSCETPAPSGEALDMEAIKTEITALEQGYADAANAKDAEAQVAYYAEDAISMPAGEALVSGKAAILERAKANMAADSTGNSTSSFETLDVFAAGDLAVEIGTWNYTNPEGETATGKFISVFEKRDGKYVCIRDIWNSDTKEGDDDGDDEAGEDND